MGEPRISLHSALGRALLFLLKMSKERKQAQVSNLQKHAIEYCKTIGADGIHDVTILGDGDYRIMYWAKKGAVRIMEAVVLRIPYVNS